MQNLMEEKPMTIDDCQLLDDEASKNWPKMNQIELRGHGVDETIFDDANDAYLIHSLHCSMQPMVSDVSAQKASWEERHR